MDSASRRRNQGTVERVFPIAWGALYAFLLLRLPRVAPEVEHDESWLALLVHDLFDGSRFGVDFIFTYGPLGFLQARGHAYHPDLYWLLVAGELCICAGAGVAVGLVTARLASNWLRAGFVLALTVTLAFASGSFLLVAICVLSLWLIEAPRGALRTAPVLAYLALLACGKFSIFLLAGLSVVAMTVAALAQRRWRTAAAVPAAYAALMIVIWALAGQSPGDLPAWIARSFEVAAGHVDGMALSGYPGQLTLGALSFLATTAACVLSVRKSAAGMVSLALLLATLFVAWKAAYVRHDVSHAALFLLVGSSLPFILLAFVEPTAPPMRSVRNALAIVATILCLVCAMFIGKSSPSGYRWGVDGQVEDEPERQVAVPPSALPGMLTSTLRDNLAAIMAPATRRAELESELAAKRDANQLPLVSELVGERSIDCVPYPVSLLILNDLNVQHRPVIQSYAAYTPELQARNAAFFDSERAPDFVLWSLASIDNKFPLMDDAGAQLALLARYRPVAAEGGHLLLERQGASPEPLLGAARDYEAVLGEPILIPEFESGLQVLSIHVDYSLVGNLRRAALRPPALSLDVSQADGSSERYTISSGSARAGFLISPLVRSTADLARLHAGEPLARPQSVQISTKDRHMVAFDPVVRLTVRDLKLEPGGGDQATRARYLELVSEVERQ